MDPGVVRRLARAFVSVLIISAFIPIGSASAVSSTAGMGHDGVVSVVSQTVYTDAEGKRWIDGVVVNDSELVLQGVRFPVTVTPPVTPLTYEEPMDGPWTFELEADGYLMKPGERTSFHALVPYEVPMGSEVVVGTGGGWATDEQPFDLEVLSVTPVVEEPEAPVEPDVPVEEPGPAVERVGSLTYEEPQPEWAARAYTVVVKNNSAVPVGDIAVFGTETQGADAETAVLLDSLTACVDDEPLSPGATATVEVRGLARSDEDTTTSIFTEVFAEALEQTFISVKFSSVAPTYGESVSFTMRLTHADGTPVLGSRTLKLYWDDGEGEGYQKFSTSTGVVTGVVRPLEKVFYTPVFWGDHRYATAIGEQVVVQPRTVVTTPRIEPTAVDAGSAFSAGGFIKPDHAAGSREIKVLCYRYENGEWVKRKIVTATVSAYAGPTAKYGARVSLPYRGKWRLRAYHPADAKTRADVSGYDYLTVK